MIYGYGRVSTTKQAKEGNSLESQELQLKKNGAEEIYLDAFTGTTTCRPEFDKLKAKLKEGDTLIVTKLDRIARSVLQGAALIEEFLNNGITVHVLNIGIMDESPTGKLMRTIFLAFAEFEKDMIVERTQQGKRIARTKPGFKDGRPKKYNRTQVSHAMQLLNEYSYNQVAAMTGISKSTLYREHRKYIEESQPET